MARQCNDDEGVEVGPVGRQVGLVEQIPLCPFSHFCTYWWLDRGWCMLGRLWQSLLCLRLHLACTWLACLRRVAPLFCSFSYCRETLKTCSIASSFLISLPPGKSKMLKNIPFLHFDIADRTFANPLAFSTLLLYQSRMETLSRLDWNDGPSHCIVWPIVDNHRKPWRQDGWGTQKPLESHRTLWLPPTIPFNFTPWYKIY